jgi:hypothetical protein
MTLLTPEGIAIMIFLIAAVSALLFGVIFSHQLNRYSTSHKISSAAEFIYTVGVLACIGGAGYALFTLLF